MAKFSARSTHAAVAVLLLAAAIVPGRAPAHHSGALYDSDRSITLAGTVKQFQWTNPHCWIELAVAGEGGEEDWSIEMGAPLNLSHHGWRAGTVKPGDEIVVVVHPTRDAGLKGGLFVSATDAAGKPLGERR